MSTLYYSNVASQVLQATPAPQPATATRGTNGPTPPPVKKGKKDAGDRFIPPGAGEKEVIRRLGSLEQGLGPIKGREALAEIARAHWSDSREFASAFLRAAISFAHHPGLNDRMRQAILRLMSKNAPPPDTSDYAHKLIHASINQILMFLPNPRKSPDGVNFVRGLAKERPLYADHLCEYTRVALLKKAGEPCW